MRECARAIRSRPNRNRPRRPNGPACRTWIGLGRTWWCRRRVLRSAESFARAVLPRPILRSRAISRPATGSSPKWPTCSISLCSAVFKENKNQTLVVKQNNKEAAECHGRNSKKKERRRRRRKKGKKKICLILSLRTVTMLLVCAGQAVHFPSLSFFLYLFGVYCVEDEELMMLMLQTRTSMFTWWRNLKLSPTDLPPSYVLISHGVFKCFSLSLSFSIFFFCLSIFVALKKENQRRKKWLNVAE